MVFRSLENIFHLMSRWWECNHQRCQLTIWHFAMAGVGFTPAPALKKTRTILTAHPARYKQTKHTQPSQRKGARFGRITWRKIKWGRVL
jgi:hypothetical protein